jgi:hypothetical protein
VNGYASIDYCVPGADDATGIDNVTTIAAAAEVNVTDVGGHPVTNETTHLYATRSFGPVAYQAVYITSREMADYSALMSYRGTIRADDGPRGDTVRC